MKQIARCEFGGGLSEISLNKLIIKLIKKNIRIPSGSQKKPLNRVAFFVYTPSSLLKSKFFTFPTNNTLRLNENLYICQKEPVYHKNHNI